MTYETSVLLYWSIGSLIAVFVLGACRDKVWDRDKIINRLTNNLTESFALYCLVCLLWLPFLVLTAFTYLFYFIISRLPN